MIKFKEYEIVLERIRCGSFKHETVTNYFIASNIESVKQQAYFCYGDLIDIISIEEFIG